MASTFSSLILPMQGLTHYYPLNSATQAADLIGSANGVMTGPVAFGDNRATFHGDDYITLPDNSDFSMTKTGSLSIVVFLTVNNWQALTGSYTHWMGKGVHGAHERTFRYHPDNHPSRPRRVSFYHFNATGGLGAGSYLQNHIATGTEFMVTAQVDLQNTMIFRDGVLRDSDPLSDYGIVPTDTSTPVWIGTRDMRTGFLNGIIRRVAFFDRILSASDLLLLWDNRGLPD
ncbi:hypothetical protein BDW02DRAFT_236590 [Decorospora gaudefroyi]|uniref:Concanavalin A-like lectin/glucanase n=1 Tax=Decorospora gaudefroyi TaxID=184978 RepID=A0A6A5KKL7_9PLEO|nr:hypothetical protein BDW02DRAFT_236590 [Decorospora gaudefroyi]